jgi:glycosyltransferase involved in cell wall biosynthesis
VSTEGAYGSPDSQPAMPLVSVRIPAYNHAPYIERCLDSVINDDYPNKELVIIDDGSRDDTYALIRDWAEKNGDRLPIRHFTQPNAGLCNTLNRLIDLCRGEYLVSLASDDVLLPGGIARRVRYLQEHAAEMAVIGDCQVIAEDDRPLHASAMEQLFHADKRRYLTKEGIKEQVVGRWAVAGPALMVRKDIYDIIGRYDSHYLVEDWHLYLRMVERDLLGFVPETVSAYRLHANNQSQSNRRIRCLWDQIRIAASRMRHFERHYQWLLLKSMFMCAVEIGRSSLLALTARRKRGA